MGTTPNSVQALIFLNMDCGNSTWLVGFRKLFLGWIDADKRGLNQVPN